MKFKFFLNVLILVLILSAATYKLLSNDFNYYFKLSNIQAISKKYFGGQVFNKTSHVINFTNWKIAKKLLPNQTNRDLGIFDADGILIEAPIEFEGKIYNFGVIKICDYANVQIIENEGIDVIKPSIGYAFCKFLNDAGWFPSVHEAF
ncbi:MAG: hypothetical protein PHV68_08755 [Candidatus Gastranaerophilales bacterium]|nr:hypothetical protein [Candidatus Gastranaerophilales bacterium]